MAGTVSRLIHGYRHNRQATAAVGIVKADEVREFFPAGIAPRSPEIDQQNPAVLLRPQLLPCGFIQIDNSLGRGWFRRNHGARTARAEKQSGQDESEHCQSDSPP